ncbi:hypothetical protein [uncultured Actinomyces sp.]|uniref:hypothetical protein n=1 Tax=uncultured Actinomyces sp. TaxID=249061 RepID=UPI0028E44D98|nr:hypothetical protein [uncultured Actinomyces sp.]
MTGHFESLINDVPGNADFLTSLAAEWDTYGNHCDGLADDVMSSAHLAPEWAGRAREDFGKSLERQRNRYINLGGDCTTASSAISVYAGAVRAGQKYIENLRYQASKLDEEVDNAPDPLEARVENMPAANVLVLEAFIRIESVKRAADRCAQDLARIVHIEPVQVNNKNPTEVGQMVQLSAAENAQIQKDLDALKNGTFNWEGMKQGQIGDCYFLASMAAMAQTPEGQRRLASMIQPHYDEHGNVDGYLVRLPDDPAHPNASPGREVFVHSKYIHGATQGGRVGVYSILEAAWGQNHPGGTNDGGNKPPGINGGMPADSFKVMTGKSATTLESDGSEGSYNPIERVSIITASILHQPMVASTVNTDATYTDGMASVDATVNGQPTQIDLYGAHAYTIVSADANGVTLCNPHGFNPKTGGGRAPATFTLSWEDYEKYYGNTAIGEL